MKLLLVADNPDRFPLEVDGVEVVAAGDYIADEQYAALRGVRLLNLCRSYRYQTNGYYVSLLAEARGHRPLPSIATIQDLRLQPVVRVVSQELEGLIERSLRPLKSSRFELPIYFGSSPAARHEPLARALFSQFPAPFIRARFDRDEDGWNLEAVRVVGAGEIPLAMRNFAVEMARRYLDRPLRSRRGKRLKHDLAILRAAEDPMGPSNERALDRFVRAAGKLGIRAELIGREDAGSLGEYDALFVRETTRVDHHTFRMARRAEAEGLVVVDDPDSILRCTNKVYLAELMRTHRIPIPNTLIVSHEDAVARVTQQIGFPCVIKRPDSSFSVGVHKYDDAESLAAALEPLFEDSELLVAQEFVPTSFDWRVGVLEERPLYVCRYHMARNHWQIIERAGERVVREGSVDALAIHEAPSRIVSLAVKAASLIGEGLYGVDVKEVGGRPLIVEVNDNPNIYAGCEDRTSGMRLYETIMEFFLRRIEEKRR